MISRVESPDTAISEVLAKTAEGKGIATEGVIMLEFAAMTSIEVLDCTHGSKGRNCQMLKFFFHSSTIYSLDLKQSNSKNMYIVTRRVLLTRFSI